MSVASTVAFLCLFSSGVVSFQGVDPTILPYCQSQPNLGIDAAALFTRSGQPEKVVDFVLYSKRDNKIFVVKDVTEDQTAKSAKAFDVPTDFPKDVLFFSSPKADHFLVYEKKNVQKVYKVTITNTITVVKESIESSIKNILENKDLKLFINDLKGRLQEMGRSASIYIFLAFDRSQKNYKMLELDTFGKAFEVKDTFNGASDEYVTLLPTISNAYKIPNTVVIRQPVPGLQVGFYYNFLNGAREPNQPSGVYFWSYFLPQDLVGCPPSPCVEDHFQEIEQYSSGSMRIYLNDWYFEFKGFGKAPDYSTAKLRDSTRSGYVWSENKLFRHNSFLDKDGLTYISHYSNDKTFKVVKPDGSSQEQDPYDLFGIKIVPAEVLFYWKPTHVLYHFDVSQGYKVMAVDMNTKKSLKMSKSFDEFFGFTIFPDAKTYNLNPLRTIYQENGIVYVFIRNYYYALSASDFSATDHKFKPTSKPPKLCTSTKFLGCKVLTPSPGVDSSHVVHPCGDIDPPIGPPPTLDTTVTMTTASTTTTTTATPIPVDPDKPGNKGGLTALHIGLIFGVLLGIVCVVVAVIFFYLKSNKKEKSGRFVGKAKKAEDGSDLDAGRSDMGSASTPSAIEADQTRSGIAFDPRADSSISDQSDIRSAVAAPVSAAPVSTV